MRPKGACSASLHCVGIAPYGGVQGVRTCNGSPSVKTFGFDTSATLRRTTQCEHWAASQREARPRLRARGTDSHASGISHWLGMTWQEAGANNPSVSAER